MGATSVTRPLGGCTDRWTCFTSFRVKASDLRFYMRDGTLIHRDLRATSVLDLIDPMAERADASQLHEPTPTDPQKPDRVEHAQPEELEPSGGWKSF